MIVEELPEKLAKAILRNFQWKTSEHSESGRYTYIYSGVDQAMTPEEALHIYSNKYRLTELGRKAVDLIITSVSNEIKKGPKMATHD